MFSPVRILMKFSGVTVYMGGEGRGGEGKMEEENNSKKVYMYVHVRNFCPSCDIVLFTYLLYFTYILLYLLYPYIRMCLSLCLC